MQFRAVSVNINLWKSKFLALRANQIIFMFVYNMGILEKKGGTVSRVCEKGGLPIIKGGPGTLDETMGGARTPSNYAMI